MHYLTRHLEAISDVSHGAEFHKPGARFMATEIDANYLIAKKKAKAVDAPTKAEAPAPAPAAQVRGRGRPPLRAQAQEPQPEAPSGDALVEKLADTGRDGA